MSSFRPPLAAPPRRPSAAPRRSASAKRASASSSGFASEVHRLGQEDVNELYLRVLDFDFESLETFQQLLAERGHAFEQGTDDLTCFLAVVDRHEVVDALCVEIVLALQKLYVVTVGPPEGPASVASVRPGEAGGKATEILARSSAIVAGGRMPTTCLTSSTGISTCQLATAAHLRRKPDRAVPCRFQGSRT